MSNEFENACNPNMENHESADAASVTPETERTTSASDGKATEAPSEIRQELPSDTASDNSSHPCENPEPFAAQEKAAPNAVPSEAAAQSEPAQSESASPAPQQAAPTQAASPKNTAERTPSESVSVFRDGNVQASYNPQNDAYSYSKQSTDGGTQNINGCLWDHTQNGKKAKKSSKGFKIFVASMLTVFTVSAVAIASLTTVNFLEAHSASNLSETSTAGITPASNNTATTATLLSSFKDGNEGLTKSQVAAKCSPSAVGIVVEVESSYNPYGYFGGFYSTPQIMQGVGSGFIYNEDGYIITNHHVVDGANKITVYLSDKTQVEAELIGSDELSDIAVIKVDPTGLNLVPMEIGNSDELSVGDEVIAIGCPAGIEYMGTVTDGIISAINRDVELTESGKASTKTMTLLQTNATINKGNSGGPLINSKGEVIGINTLKLSADYEGIGFSIPINGALPIISQLMEFGKVVERSENDFVSSTGVIGISASAISASEAEYYDIPQGVLVVQIDKDSSAAKAGLRRGDIITAYNGTEVKTVDELNQLKLKNKAGDEVTVSVYRDSDDSDGKTFDITFKLDIG